MYITYFKTTRNIHSPSSNTSSHQSIPRFQQRPSKHPNRVRPPKCPAKNGGRFRETQTRAPWRIASLGEKVGDFFLHRLPGRLAKLTHLKGLRLKKNTWKGLRIETKLEVFFLHDFDDWILEDMLLFVEWMGEMGGNALVGISHLATARWSNFEDKVG